MNLPSFKQIWLPALLLVGGIVAFWIVPALSGPPKVDLKIVPGAGASAQKP